MGEGGEHDGVGLFKEEASPSISDGGRTGSEKGKF
jgi:hypothetical protein